VSLPLPRSSQGPPIGVQLIGTIGTIGTDQQLLQNAAWLVYASKNSSLEQALRQYGVSTLRDFAMRRSEAAFARERPQL
jgi:hypothetical protein